MMPRSRVAVAVRLAWLSATLAALTSSLGCQRGSQPDAVRPADCEGASEDWLTWLMRSADGAQRFEAASPGWIALYRRDYVGALAAFKTKADDPIARAGRTRAHRALARLHDRLADLHANALIQYLDARRASGAKSFRAGPRLAAVAAAVGSVEPPRWAQAGNKVFGQAPSCDRPAGTAAELVWQHLKCERSPSCPRLLAKRIGGRSKADKGRARNGNHNGNHNGTKSWSGRLKIYANALCKPDAVDDRTLSTLAVQPAVRERLSIPGEVVDSTTVVFFDPLALWVSARVHEARARAASPDGLPADWMAHVLSEAPDGQSRPAIADMAAARAAADRWQAKVAAARRCAADGAGVKLADELGVTTSLADGVLRRTAAHLVAKKNCGDALALLRQTLDLNAADKMSYRNEPGFLVQLASAAVCMRRMSEAIGALRAVRRAYPEAKGALTVVERLAVSRLMGGVGGLQKRH